MTELLYGIAVAPFKDMAGSPAFFAEVLIGGVFAGLMYSLVALGFVLIYKASGVFNFAQGVMVLFAALTFVGQLQLGMPIWAALATTITVMVALAFVIERVVLRPLVNQAPIILFMATIGITFFLTGFGQLVWGSDIKVLDIGIPKEPIIVGGILINEFDLVAAAVAGALVAGLAVFFQKTTVGRALRAVADDHQAALSVGIPLKTIWVIVWSVAGIVGLVTGIMWGSSLGVQFSLSLIALKALPVLILGGFTSIPGAIVGGLVVGAGEKVAEVFWGPAFGGAIEDWFAYMLALGFMAVGAFAAFKLTTSFPGLDVVVVFLLGGLIAAAVGVVFGLPSLRIKGFYLAVAALAAQFFLIWMFNKFPWFFNYSPSGVISAPPRAIFGHYVTGAEADPRAKYLFVLTVVAVLALVAKNLVRGRIGRSWMAIRDMDIAAELIGIRPLPTKLLAFAVSSFYCGIAGAMWAFIYTSAVEASAFEIDRSFQILFMVIIGGLGSILGSFLGAAFIVLLPIFLNNAPRLVGLDVPVNLVTNLQAMT